MSASTSKIDSGSALATAGRAGLMEFLYEEYGRHDPSHPQHSLYTGLLEEASRDIGRSVLHQAAAEWGLSAEPAITVHFHKD